MVFGVDDGIVSLHERVAFLGELSNEARCIGNFALGLIYSFAIL